MPYNVGKGGTQGKGNTHQGLGYQPQSGEQRKCGSRYNWCWRLDHKEVQCWLKQEFPNTSGASEQDAKQRDIRDRNQGEGDAFLYAICYLRSTIHDTCARKSNLSTTQADDHPIIDSRSCVSTIPKNFASNIDVVEFDQQMLLLSVLGEPLKHCGTRRNVPFTAGDGSEMRVSFEVTDATRPILSVRKGVDIGAMTIFKLCGEGKIIRDAAAIQKITKNLRNDVYENGAYVLDSKTIQRSSGQYVQPTTNRNEP